jgi:hypothetical protein
MRCADLRAVTPNRYSRVEIESMRTAESKLRRTRSLFAITILVAIIVGSLVWLNWDRVSAPKYDMSVVFDGRAPWGDVGPESETDKAPTVLYRTVGKSYCYTAFQLSSLRDRLERENKLHVQVEYNVFTTFGHEGRYTLRSVDGVSLAIGNRIIQETREFGGQILLSGDEALSCP